MQTLWQQFAKFQIEWHSKKRKSCRLPRVTEYYHLYTKIFPLSLNFDYCAPTLTCVDIFFHTLTIGHLTISLLCVAPNSAYTQPTCKCALQFSWLAAICEDLCPNRSLAVCSIFGSGTQRIELRNVNVLLNRR